MVPNRLAPGQYQFKEGEKYLFVDSTDKDGTHFKLYTLKCLTKWPDYVDAHCSFVSLQFADMESSVLWENRSFGGLADMCVVHNAEKNATATSKGRVLVHAYLDMLLREIFILKDRQGSSRDQKAVNQYAYLLREYEELTQLIQKKTEYQVARIWHLGSRPDTVDLVQK